MRQIAVFAALMLFFVLLAHGCVPDMVDKQEEGRRPLQSDLIGGR
jgi:hypothetical protein